MPDHLDTDRSQSAAKRVAPRESPPASPCLLVIFGASGDLTKRKLIPALYNLRRGKLLTDRFAVVGVSRSPMSDEEFRQRAAEDLQEATGGKPDGNILSWLLERVHYVPLDAEDPSAYAQLCQRLKALDEQRQTGGEAGFFPANPPPPVGPARQQPRGPGLPAGGGRQ